MKKIKDFLLNDKKNLIILIGLILVILLVVWFCLSGYGPVNDSKAKNIVLKKTKFDKDKVIFREVNLDEDKNQYTVEIDYNAIIFNFVIDADTGKIIKNNFDDYPDKNFESPIHYEYVSKTRAKELVANDLKADIKDIDFLKVDLKKDTYSAVYDIKASYDKYIYTYKVDAIGESILPKYTSKVEKK